MTICLVFLFYGVLDNDMMNTRKNIKARLNCTDEQVDNIIKIVNDAAAIGIFVNLDLFVSFLEKEIAIQMYGDPNVKTDLLGLNITNQH